MILTGHSLCQVEIAHDQNRQDQWAIAGIGVIRVRGASVGSVIPVDPERDQV